MTRQYLIGELSVRLAQLQATTGQAAPQVARLRAEVETGPLTALDAGVPLRGVQEAACHADPRTRMR
jgi:hypothetical protein